MVSITTDYKYLQLLSINTINKTKFFYVVHFGRV